MAEAENSSPQIADYVLPLLGLTSVAAALLVFTGWEYEKAYVEEWGLPYSAFAYTPWELMLTSGVVVLGLIGVFFGLILVEFVRSFFRAHEAQPKPRSHWTAADWAELSVYALVAGAGTLALTIKALVGHDLILVTIMILAAAYVLGYVGWLMTQRGIANAHMLVWGAVFLGAFMFLAAFPARAGQARARDDRNHVDRLPRAILTVGEAGTLPLTPNGCSESGPWRVVRINNGHYWLLADHPGARDIVEIDEAKIASVEYFAKSGTIAGPCDHTAEGGTTPTAIVGTPVR